MKNNWKKAVSDKTIELLLAWTERKTCGGKRSSTPRIEKRYLFKLQRDKNNRLIVRSEILEGHTQGISRSRSNNQHWDKIDEFGMAFLDLTEQEQLVIMANIDPYDELQTKEKWREFLSEAKIYRQQYFEILLTNAMFRLQRLCEKRGLVNKMAIKNELWGWPAIKRYIGISIPTLIEMSKDGTIPITLIGRQPYTTEDILDKWKIERITKVPYGLAQKELKKRSKMRREKRKKYRYRSDE
jgi:hypothetical protein